MQIVDFLFKYTPFYETSLLIVYRLTVHSGRCPVKRLCTVHSSKGVIRCRLGEKGETKKEARQLFFLISTTCICSVYLGATPMLLPCLTTRQPTTSRRFTARPPDNEATARRFTARPRSCDIRSYYYDACTHSD